MIHHLQLLGKEIILVGKMNLYMTFQVLIRGLTKFPVFAGFMTYIKAL